MQVFFTESGSTEAFLGGETRPYAPNAWPLEFGSKTGYKIDFNLHRPQFMCGLEDFAPTPWRWGWKRRGC